MRTVRKSKEIKFLSKLHLLQAIVIAVLLYGCKSWKFNVDIEKDLTHLNSNATGNSLESLSVNGAPTIASSWRLKD